MKLPEIAERMVDINTAVKNPPIYIGQKFLERRQTLDGLLLYDLNDTEKFNKLGIELLRPKTDFHPRLMCFGYLFYNDIFDTDKFLEAIRTSENKLEEAKMLNDFGNLMTQFILKDQKKYRTNDWKDGSMVMYSLASFFPIGTIDHVGIMRDGKVDSKFDIRSTYLHPKEIVPYNPYKYGPWIANFKFNKEIVSDFWLKTFKQPIQFLKP